MLEGQSKPAFKPVFYNECPFSDYVECRAEGTSMVSANLNGSEIIIQALLNEGVDTPCLVILVALCFLFTMRFSNKTDCGTF